MDTFGITRKIAPDSRVRLERDQETRGMNGFLLQVRFRSSIYLPRLELEWK